ncbi:MAG: 3-deoxy-7-phosphoheptulonate synthase, partial [Alistipes sp.]|nr:3-deoxy-7-phosphoheptulonate synthase [Alistipes sp.]
MNELLPIFPPQAGSRRPLVIAGPCSAETEEQTVASARALAACGVRIFRAGLWKPRTKPGGFEGVGAEGIGWLQRVKRETGMYVATEVATPHHAERALAGGIDLLWIGARTTANPFAIQELA